MSTVTNLLYLAACLSGVAAVSYISGVNRERRRYDAMIARAFATYRAQQTAGDPDGE